MSPPPERIGPPQLQDEDDLEVYNDEEFSRPRDLEVPYLTT